MTSGPIVQLGERFVRIEEVTGSTPARSTKKNLGAFHPMLPSVKDGQRNKEKSAGLIQIF